MRKKHYRRSYIKEWREYRDMSQEDLAEHIGMTAASISRVENGKQPYNQVMLENIARVLDCDPVDLLAFMPTTGDGGDVLKRLRQLTEAERARALRILGALQSD